MKSKEKPNDMNARPTSDKNSPDEGPEYLLPITFMLCILSIAHIGARWYFHNDRIAAGLSFRYHYITITIGVVFSVIVGFLFIGYSLGTKIMRIPMMFISLIAICYYIFITAWELDKTRTFLWVRLYDFGFTLGLALNHGAYILIIFGSWRYKYSNIKKTARMKPLILTFDSNMNNPNHV